MTIASVLHQYSPYRISNGLTSEGLRSLSGMSIIFWPYFPADPNIALRSTLHPTDALAGSEVFPKERLIRVFILGARAESQLPHDVWQQLGYLFPMITFHLYFVGPEASCPRDRQVLSNHKHSSSTRQCTFFTFRDLYQTLHTSQEFAPFDPYQDVFFLFSPGIGHQISEESWAPAIPMLLDTRCAIFFTGYDKQDMETDYQCLHKNSSGEFDVLLKPQPNVFGSQKWDVSFLDVRETIKTNWGVWGARGKRYQVQMK
jgi:splicing suppressor protein 51